MPALSNDSNDRLSQVTSALLQRDIQKCLAILGTGVRHRFTCIVEFSEAKYRVSSLADKAGRRTPEQFQAYQTSGGLVLRTTLTPQMTGPDPGPSTWTGELPIVWSQTAPLTSRSLRLGVLFHFDTYQQQQLPAEELELLHRAAAMISPLLYGAEAISAPASPKQPPQGQAA